MMFRRNISINVFGCRLLAVAICAAALSAMPGTARGQIFETNSNGFAGNGTTNEYNLDGSTATAPLLSGLYLPEGIAVSGSDLFVAGSSYGGTIGEYTLGGSAIPFPVTGLNGPLGLAVAGSYLFVTNDGNGTVGEYTTSGTTVNPSLITGLSSPTGIVVSGANIYVANGGNGTIGVYTLGGTPGTIASSIPTLVSGLIDPWGLALSGTDLFVSNQSIGSIGEYTTSGGTISTSLITGLTNPEGLAISGSELFVANNGAAVAGEGTIGEYTLGSVPGTITSSNPSLVLGLYEPAGITVVPEPSTWAVLAIGAAGLLAFRPRRSQA